MLSISLNLKFTFSALYYKIYSKEEKDKCKADIKVQYWETINYSNPSFNRKSHLSICHKV